MGKKLKLKTGDKFNRLELVELSIDLTRQGFIGLWKCECGNSLNIINSRVVSGHTKSCGCLKKDTIQNRSILHNCANKHKETPEYTTWQRIRYRCYNPNSRAYEYYGGRGIKVCDRWRNSFSDFLEDMGKRPSKKHSIDRINSNGNYEPSNCRWATTDIQSKNRKGIIKLLYLNNIYCLKDLCKLLNLKYSYALFKYNKKGILPENVTKYEEI